MGIAVKLLNKWEYTDITGQAVFGSNERGYIKLWTELKGDFVQSTQQNISKVFIYGGQLHNTDLAINDPYNDDAQGFIVQSVE
jgi:hypothetical protein